jgi:hypothetical protein
MLRSTVPGPRKRAVAMKVDARMSPRLVVRMGLAHERAALVPTGRFVGCYFYPLGRRGFIGAALAGISLRDCHYDRDDDQI